MRTPHPWRDVWAAAMLWVGAFALAAGIAMVIGQTVAEIMAW